MTSDSDILSAVAEKKMVYFQGNIKKLFWKNYS
jgi:hypothetical protein